MFHFVAFESFSQWTGTKKFNERKMAKIKHFKPRIEQLVNSLAGWAHNENHQNEISKMFDVHLRRELERLRIVHGT